MNKPVVYRQFYHPEIPTYEKGISLAWELKRSGEHFKALDVLDLLLNNYPVHAVKTLSDAYEMSKQIPQTTRYYQYQGRFVEFDITPGMKVLDIGSGNMPFPYATHLADADLNDGQLGRAGEPFKVVANRKIVNCNIENLPFSDKEFDVVYCSHVLEHVSNPEKACNELMRVGKAGYIECPTRGKDLFFNYAEISNHRWGVEIFNNTLLFSEYSQQDIKGLNSNVLNVIMECPETLREKAFSGLMVLKANLVNTMMVWDDCFEYSVRRLSVKNVTASRITEKQNTVSVVIPTFNREKMLVRAIQSVQAQTSPVCEIIVADDQSTDKTADVVRELSRYDHRIKYIKLEKKGGAQAARNAGIRAATGEWIAFLDSDDEWLPEKMSRQLAAADRYHADVVHCEFMVKRDGNLQTYHVQSISGNVLNKILIKSIGGFTTFLIRKEALIRIGYLDEAITSWQEWDTAIRLAKHYVFGFVSEPSFVWHWHDGETISKDNYREAAGYYQIIEKHRDDIVRYAGMDALLRHYTELMGKFKGLNDYAKFQEVRQKAETCLAVLKQSQILGIINDKTGRPVSSGNAL